MALDVEIPAMGESVIEVILIEWLKEDGEYVERDEAVCVLETDKANVDLPAPTAGVLKHGAELDSTLGVGAVIAQIEEGDQPAAESVEAQQSTTVENAPDPAAEQAVKKAQSPAARRLAEEHSVDVAEVEGTGKNGLITKEDVRALIDVQETPKAQPSDPTTQLAAQPAPPAPASALSAEGEEDGQRREPMSRLRQRIAQHLVSAQHSAAMLTTFNEIDLSAVMELRALYKERFAEVHGISLGFMSFFSRAAVLAPRASACRRTERIAFVARARRELIVSSRAYSGAYSELIATISSAISLHYSELIPRRATISSL